MTGVVLVSKWCKGDSGEKGKAGESNGSSNAHLSLFALLFAAIRKSIVSCRMDRREEATVTVHRMEISWPTNIKHVAHVTFDRFHGFLGLPVEFQLEIPRKVPSASASVFGVSAESMQCSYDTKGNSVPMILLLMQEELYTRGGLKAEGIFRINPENSQEDHVRDQLSKGIVPEDIDVHRLAGLIKAWFRELPVGVLDGLSPDQVLQCNTEGECVELVKLLLPTQAALLNWAIDLMADVVEEEEASKMNARNIAMVFAPNMTRMADPLTALMHAVQVMNLLKTLILKTIRERQESSIRGSWPSSPHDQEVDNDDLDSQQDSGMSCELEGSNSDEEHVTYSPCSGDGGASLNGIEECFLKQLGEEIKDDHENLATKLEGSYVNLSSSPSIPERRHMGSNGPDENAEFGFSVSNSKNGSYCKSEEEQDSFGGEIEGTVGFDLKEGSTGKDAEMADAEVESQPGWSPTLRAGLGGLLFPKS